MMFNKNHRRSQSPCHCVKATAIFDFNAMRFAIIMMLLGTTPAFAQRGATVPWTTYEAEAMATTGTILGPPPKAVDKNAEVTNTLEIESSRLQCVKLSAAGQYVQFTAQATANAMVVRYSVPDTADGGGADYTLSLYINGTFAQKLTVTSKYSW